LRIVEEIRRRIASGDLRPGDPVPSARRITQDWGVALATATRALATLNAEGVTRSVPGVATVVAPASSTGTGNGGRARRGDVELNRDRIVASAIAIADAEGLAQVSMRRIATDLGVATMSLYRHVAGKDELLIYMMDAVLGEERLPKDPPEGWRARLELSSRLQWKGFRRHPWLAPALSITRPQIVVNGMRHTEWALAALDTVGLTGESAMHVHITLFGFVRGLALSLEPEAQAEQDTGLTSDEWMSTQQDEFLAVLRGGEFPMMGRLFTMDLELDLDALFEFGLSRILDGLERYLPGPATGAAGRGDQAAPAT